MGGEAGLMKKMIHPPQYGHYSLLRTESISQEYDCANLSLKQIPLNGSLLRRLPRLQILINARCHFAAFGDGPDDK